MLNLGINRQVPLLVPEVPVFGSVTWRRQKFPVFPPRVCVVSIRAVCWVSWPLSRLGWERISNIHSLHAAWVETCVMVLLSAEM